MREILTAQKTERDRLLNAGYVQREGLQSLQSALDHTLIKVITGPRRAGKSVFAIEALKHTDFAYVNFDDERIAGSLDGDALLKGIKQVYGDTKLLLLDEIQNIQKWELLLNRLHRNGYNLVVTGSNSRLLSRELASHLTGRFIEFQILPFSFREFLSARKSPGAPYPAGKEAQGRLLALFSEYLQSGGYPEVIVNRIDHRSYLKTIFDSVLFKDIVQRFRIRNSLMLRDIGYYLLTNHSTLASWNNIAEALGQKSVATLQKYASYINQAYFIFTVQRFSYKAAVHIKSPQKLYAYDTGMIDAVSFKFSENIGRILENAVAIELSRNVNKPIYYFKTTNGKEVDFLVKDGLQVSEMIQVCYDLSNPKTKKRELSALLHASAELKCKQLKVITWDMDTILHEKGHEIEILPAVKWILGRS
jgi:uncharacterized protein